MLCARPLLPKDLFKGHGTFWLRRLTLCLEVGVRVQLQHRWGPSRRLFPLIPGILSLVWQVLERSCWKR